MRNVDHLADTWTQISQYIVIHGGRLHTYTSVADYYGLKICPAVGHDGCLVATKAEHNRGVTLPRERVIHWTPRRLTKMGLRRFLMVISHTRVKGWFLMNHAMQIYAENVWATSAARDLRVRFPTRYSSADRRRLRWLISQGAPVTTPARRWAARKEQP